MRAALLLVWMPALLAAHDANGRSSAPLESRRLVNPLQPSEAALYSASATFSKLCAECHGADGKSRTKLASTLPSRPTDLTDYLMQAMKDGEIYWIITNGAEKGMPAYGKQLTDAQRWEMVFWVRELRVRELYAERIQLGTYEWQLPPGFPHPKVPADNLMTAEKVELGRLLFYDKRLSANQKQSCGTCHRQDKAFTDGRARGLGSTGELHPRGPMSLINVAYNSVLTWANPNVTKLERQALVPMFGEHPVELGMAGKEDELVVRLKAEPRYARLFPVAFPSEREPVTIGNTTKAIAAFERTLLSGDSPYDEYRRGDDADAISESAKRGEKLFYSERLECFHCHGGFNFTGSLDYLGKGSPEVEFHNTGLYNLKTELTYPEDAPGLFEFTRQKADAGKFKAPTLRNIALTAPYMHDGSVNTLEEAIEHYRAGGRTIKTGPLAGVGFENPNKSEFVKSFELTPAEKTDLLEFLKSLTDPYVAVDQRWADPWSPKAVTPPVRPRHLLLGEVVEVYPEAGSVTLKHGAVTGFLKATGAEETREFIVRDKKELDSLQPGARISAGVRRRGADYVIENVRSQSRR